MTHPHLSMSRAAGLTIVMFMLMYNISFRAAPSASTGRIAVVILSISLGRRGTVDCFVSFVSENRVAATMIASVAIYAAVQYALGGFQDTDQLSRLVHFILLSVFGSIAFAALIRYDIRAFVSIFAVAAFVQAIFILYSYVSPEYRTWLSNLLVQGGAIPLTYDLQVPGFSNSSGAALSAVQGLGAFAALYATALWPGVRRRAILALMGLTCALSTVVTGRTGLLLSVCFFVAFALTTRRVAERLIITGIIAASLAVTLSYRDEITAVIGRYNTRVASTLNWSIGLFERASADPVLDDLTSQKVRTLNLSTMLGTGRVTDAYGNASGNDSGYIQTYYALGLVAAVIFYVSLLGLLMRYVLASDQRLIHSLLVLSMFVVEFKEPFIFNHTFPFFVAGLVYLARSTSQLGGLRPDVRYYALDDLVDPAATSLLRVA